MSSANTPKAPIDPLTGLSAARLGVYVHFPYCLSKCPYCDFASVAARVVPEEAYTQAILTELEVRLGAHGLKGQEVHSVYFGGGTPSLWAPARVGRVLEALTAHLHLAPQCEVTLEANPGASDAARFAGLRRVGINRLSIGFQSLDSAVLRRLGRDHTPADARQALSAARLAGFDNISVDLMYGAPGQTLGQVGHDAAQVVELGPQHVSAYALTAERDSLAEVVPFTRQVERGELVLPPDELVVEMQRALTDTFERAGLQRYEVSNYARPGLHSRHNSLYWTGGEYLALGAGATGMLCSSGGPFRYTNHRSAERYLMAMAPGLAEPGPPEAARELLGTAELFSERVALGLRLTTGIDLQATCQAFGVSASARLDRVRGLVREGLAWERDGRVGLTARGLELHSAIAARLI